MTVFHDRRTDAYEELTGDLTIPSSLNLTYSGGQLPSRPDIDPQYPVDQTASVVDMR